MFKNVKPLLENKLIYETDRGLILKICENEKESNFLRVLSREPKCSPYIVCMIDSFNISYKQAYELTKGHIRNFLRYSDDLRTYNVMILEKMEGTVEDLLRIGVFDKNPREVIRVYILLLIALGYCHEKNICHRDISVSNVLYKKTEKGIIYKLSDFGESCGDPVETCENLDFQKEKDITDLGLLIIDIMLRGSSFDDEDELEKFLENFIIPKTWSPIFITLFHLAIDMFLSKYKNVKSVMQFLNLKNITINSI